MLYDFEAVTSIKYLAMKFPTSSGFGVIHGRQEEAKAVYLAIVEEQNAWEEEVDPEVIEVRNKEKKMRTKPIDKMKNFLLLKL